MPLDIIFYLNNHELNTGWMDAPEAIPNTGEYVALPQVKGESLVEKILHRFVEENGDVVQRLEIYLKNEHMLQ